MEEQREFLNRMGAKTAMLEEKKERKDKEQWQISIQGNLKGSPLNDFMTNLMKSPSSFYNNTI